MRTPLKPLPGLASRWIGRAGRLRWLDAIAAWLVLGAVLHGLLPSVELDVPAVLAAVLVAALAAVPPFRRRWRPVSAAVAVALGWRLRPGDRAWHVGPDGVRLVLVTAARWRHVAVAAVVRDSQEGITLRRTRALLVPAEPDRRPRGRRGEATAL